MAGMPLGSWAAEQRVRRRKMGTKSKKGEMGRAYFEQLDGMGFVWCHPTWAWEMTRDTLMVYAEVHGDLLVRSDFEVPSEAPWPKASWGMKLGSRVKDIRRGKRVKDKPERRAELDSMGFVWCRPTWAWETTRDTLLVYAEVHGDLLVRSDFEVPSEAPWPKASWGMKLGSRVKDIRSEEMYVRDKPERRAELDAMGFVWDEFERHWEETRDALKMYAKVHGDLLVRSDFEVPSEAPWPKAWWGMKLGSRVHNIRTEETHAKDKPGRRAELDSMGFVWDDLERRWEMTRDALKMYAEVHGDLLVRFGFEVPSEAPWPKASWGLKLGHRVSYIRKGQMVKDKPGRRAELDSMGFVWAGRAFASRMSWMKKKKKKQ